eukprot:31408-Pelagococcus_subviridis.AAC.16
MLDSTPPRRHHAMSAAKILRRVAAASAVVVAAPDVTCISPPAWTPTSEMEMPSFAAPAGAGAAAAAASSTLRIFAFASASASASAAAPASRINPAFAPSAKPTMPNDAPTLVPTACAVVRFSASTIAGSAVPNAMMTAMQMLVPNAIPHRFTACPNPTPPKPHRSELAHIAHSSLLSALPYIVPSVSAPTTATTNAEPDVLPLPDLAGVKTARRLGLRRDVPAPVREAARDRRDDARGGAHRAEGRSFDDDTAKRGASLVVMRNEMAAPRRAARCQGEFHLRSISYDS